MSTRFLVAIAMTAACASEHGVPLEGRVQGTFMGAAFAPQYAIARDLVDPKSDGSSLELQLSDGPINCDTNLGADETVDGVYAQLYLPNPSVQTVDNRMVVLSRVVTENNIRFVGLSTFSNTGSIVLTEVTVDTLVGTLTYRKTDEYTLAGDFVIARCPAP